MQEPPQILDTDGRRLLTEVGYLACLMNQAAAGRRILAGLEAVAPGSREVVIGEALVSLTEGQPEAAANRLRDLAARKDPHGTVFLGLALRLAGRAAESQAVLATLPPGDASADGLAGALRSAA